MTEEKRIRCGDHVFHRPSGEKWVVAYADYESGKLAWIRHVMERKQVMAKADDFGAAVDAAALENTKLGDFTGMRAAILRVIAPMPFGGGQTLRELIADECASKLVKAGYGKLPESPDA